MTELSGFFSDKKLSPEEAGICLEEFAKLKSLGAAVTAKHLPGSRMLTLESADKVGMFPS